MMKSKYNRIAKDHMSNKYLQNLLEEDILGIVKEEFLGNDLNLALEDEWFLGEPRGEGLEQAATSFHVTTEPFSRQLTVALFFSA
jgi:hypothetical protein